MTTQRQILDFYSQPAAMTSGGAFAAHLEDLPNDVGGLARIVQGLAVHEYAASGYDIEILDELKGETQIRPVERMLERRLASQLAVLWREVCPVPRLEATPEEQRMRQ